jgi:Carboxypeptidase regulatory-like domain
MILEKIALVSGLKKDSCRNFTGRRASFSILSLLVLAGTLFIAPLAQSQPAAPTTPAPTPTTPAQQISPQTPGNISGTVKDQTGAFVPGARVVLTRNDDPSTKQETQTDMNGQFVFVYIAPGAFQLSISATNFTTQVVAGKLAPGQAYVVPDVALPLAPNVTQVTVTLTQEELAEQQIKVQETQRVLGLIPNFFVTYDPDAQPLNSRQKFELAWKSSVDPVTVVAVAAFAGVQQATNSFKGYGQGAQGYGKRFGATYADVVDGTFMGSAIFPSLLKQDPRYFYKGTGSFKSRLLYALVANSWICKGDDKKWQPNYSNILGNLVAGGIANAYYPPNNRGAALTFETAGIRIGETMASGVFQEFIVKKLTPSAAHRSVSQP